MKKYSILLVILFASLFAIAQDIEKIDSLESVLKKESSDSLKAEIQLELVWAYIQKSDVEQTDKLLKELFVVSKEQKWNTLYYRAFRAWGAVFKKAGNFDSATYCFDQSLNYFKTTNEYKYISEAYHNKAIVAFMTNQQDQLFEMVKLGGEYANKSKDEKQIYNVLELEIIALATYGILNDTVILKQEKLMNYLEHNSSALRYNRAKGNLAIYHNRMGNTEVAIKLLLESLKYFETKGVPDELANKLMTLGVFYGQEGMDFKALEYLKKTVPISISSKNDHQLASVYRQISIANENILRQDDTQIKYYDSSLKYSLKAEVLARKTKNNSLLFQILSNRAQQLLSYKIIVSEDEKYDLSEVETLLKEAKQIMPEGEQVTAVKMDYWRALLFFKYLNKDYKNTVAIGKKMLTVSEDFPAMVNWTVKKDINQRLYESYQKMGQHKAALQHSIGYSQAKDSLYKQQQVKALSDASEKYETDKKEAENKVLNANLEKQTANQRLLWGGLIGALALGLFVFLFFNQKRLVSQKNYELEKQELMSVIDQKEKNKMDGILDALEDERKRIAKDLHDRVGSILSTVKLHYGNLIDRLDKTDAKLDENTMKISSLLDQSVQEVRQVSHNMISGVLADFGLLPAVYDLSESIQQSGGLNVVVSDHNVAQRFDKNIEINLYRIIQELFSNTIKHANATEVNLSITRLDKELAVVYDDNGKGFDVSEQKKGIGMKNIQARLKKINGMMDIDSNNLGSAFIIKIELNKNEAV